MRRKYILIWSMKNIKNFEVHSIQNDHQFFWYLNFGLTISIFASL